MNVVLLFFFGNPITGPPPIRPEVVRDVIVEGERMARFFKQNFIRKISVRTLHSKWFPLEVTHRCRGRFYFLKSFPFKWHFRKYPWSFRYAFWYFSSFFRNRFQTFQITMPGYHLAHSQTHKIPGINTQVSRFSSISFCLIFTFGPFRTIASLVSTSRCSFITIFFKNSKSIPALSNGSCEIAVSLWFCLSVTRRAIYFTKTPLVRR